MSKRSQKQAKKNAVTNSNKSKVNTINLSENSVLKLLVGPQNVKRWNSLKSAFSCESNEDFATKLLDLAQEHLSKSIQNGAIKNEKPPSKPKKKTNGELEKGKNKTTQTESNFKKLVKEDNENSEKIPDFVVSKTESNDQSETISNTNFGITIIPILQCDSQTTKKVEYSDNLQTENINGIKKNLESDIRKAPELNQQNDSTHSITEIASKTFCENCSSSHNQTRCPLCSPKYIALDCISQEQWQIDQKALYSKNSNVADGNDLTSQEKDTMSYSKLSLPKVLYFDNVTGTGDIGVFARDQIEEHTQFGPLIGKKIKEVDIPEDCSMRYIWEVSGKNGNIYINTEDVETSNWARSLRPASTRELKNLAVRVSDNVVYFVSTRSINAGEELLYWHDLNTVTHKKKMEKSSCGGCNMTFLHPIFYRTHCSVFHDVRFSLTIRKYHCKVCGAAVLGKENIMKHAMELHNGQGAYQCQFCKKFFLRLNYLEMHRTYGCSANPHRSRPLCDFCGKKFCQPQKLKVHIKRMHSDFSLVLKEFQCKNCLKILGSRAALQRHLKEVHKKQLDGNCSCSKCGKHFQNKSNLKIHMLTHSGIKPFKCAMANCQAAFTTKQCLQFHYKKTHNLAEDDMPKIERSIDYTFEAYCGGDDGLLEDKSKENVQESSMEFEDSDNGDTSIDSQNLDDPPPVLSPTTQVDKVPSKPNSPLDDYNISGVNGNMKILSKGSKKWIADEPLKSDLYHLENNRVCKDPDLSSISLQVPPEAQIYDRNKLTTDFGRHDSSNASLLVEAALDSVCSEPNIDIDVTSTNCTDSLVNNLYSLPTNDSLPEVSYSENRDINLISPSVNDHISVTDELGDDLQQNQNIGMDYSFHQEDFTPGNSPGSPHRSSFVGTYMNSIPNQNQTYDQPKNLTPAPSPPRYDFGHNVATDHLSSDDSNGMAAQNLSLHGAKNDMQLDLSIYKSPLYHRKDLRDSDRKQNYLIAGDLAKNYEEENIDNEQITTDLSDKTFNAIPGLDLKEKDSALDRSKYSDDLSVDLRAKFDLDLDLRLKSYENIDSDSLRLRTTNYETSNPDLDFRNKNYDVIDAMENRGKPYDSIDTEFRTDRSFEPLILNSSELQGLDMSARSFHNYSNINRYHHLYPDLDRVDLRLNYSPPPPTYTHADILRVVSLDLTPPGRPSVDLSLRGHPLHQIANTRLLTDHTLQPNSHRLLDQSRLLGSDLSAPRHLTDTRLLGDTNGRILSDHTTNRILGNNDQISSNHLLSSEQSRLLPEDSRLLADQPRLLEQSRLLGESRILPPGTSTGTVSPVPAFPGYSVSQSPYHPPTLAAPRPHVSSPTPPYHHYSSYY